MAVQIAFNKCFPGVKGKWSMDDGKYEASFKKDGQDISVFHAMFDVNGQLIKGIKQ
jgi:hypothetical protein